MIAGQQGLPGPPSGRAIGAAALAVLSRSLVVVGDVKLKLERLPERPSEELLRSVGADVALFIVTVSGANAARLFREVDAATGGALHVAPRSEKMQITASSESVLEARSRAASLALRLGFSAVERTRVATVVSELARNIHLYAGEGVIDLEVVEGVAVGLMVRAHDDGPGIPDVDAVFSDGFRSVRGMGLGLKGVKRVAQEFRIRSEAGRGTTVEATFRPMSRAGGRY